MPPSSRRAFLRAFAAVALTSVATPVTALASALRRRDSHPTPRAGITGDKVLTAAQLDGSEALVPLFDAVRKIPEVVDGIRCSCGCADVPGYYSLLSCYEGDGMARACPICEGQGRLVTRLHRAGKTLDQIREAVDAQFG